MIAALRRERELMVGPNEGAPQDAGRSAPSWRGPSNVALLVVAVVLVLAGVFAFVASRASDRRPTSSPTAGLPRGISPRLAATMALAAVPRARAPGFTLTDQRGATVSLAQFKGRAVVLEFMDPHCTDICPIVSYEFVDAYHRLGSTADKVVFLAVNVNRFHRGVAAMAAYTSAHSLSVIPTWHFVTGSTHSLAAVWRAYGIAVKDAGPNVDVKHTSVVFFIGRDGRERFLANPVADYTMRGTAYLPAGQIAAWGRGIAAVASELAN